MRGRRWALDARVVIGLLAVAGVGSGLLLDRAGFLADQPLTGNVVAGILGAPATVLLAVFVFNRLIAAQRADEWLGDHQTSRLVEHDDGLAVRIEDCQPARGPAERPQPGPRPSCNGARPS